MKRRVIKKWINRYITPLVKDMPITQYRALELTNPNRPDQRHVIVGTQIKCINGEFVREGQIGPKSKGMYNDIRNTSEALKRLTLENPHLRKMQYSKRYGFYIRIIDFKDWPEGYVFVEEQYI